MRGTTPERGGIGRGGDSELRSLAAYSSPPRCARDRSRPHTACTHATPALLLPRAPRVPAYSWNPPHATRTFANLLGRQATRTHATPCTADGGHDRGSS